MFHWHDERHGVRRVFTSREGGGSEAPYASLNLGQHVGDDPDSVLANRDRVAAALGLASDHLVFMDQQHGAEVAVVTGPGAPSPCDAMVTTTPGLALGVLVADCAPVLLSDAEQEVVAVAHAGRPGLVAGVIDRVVTTMREIGARRISAAVGPSVCGRCYEVPEEMRDLAASVVPEAATVSWTGTPAVDVAAGVVTQLRANDVDVIWVAGCTRESAALYSYRRDGRTGRTAGVIVRTGSR